jgi:pimeloyl-ACP methyl ester carboxylesterase
MKFIQKYAVHFILLALLFIPQAVGADTLLRSPQYFSGTVLFTEENSPYIVDGDMTVHSGAKLVVKEGVTIRAIASSTKPYRPFITVYGDLSIEGTKEKPVRVENMNNLILYGPQRNITYAIFERSPIRLARSAIYGVSTTTISKSIFMNSTTSLDVHHGKLTITDSEFRNNGTGISLESKGFWSDFVVKNSSFENNGMHIRNLATLVANARENWWGSVEGPGTLVSGNILFEPWLTAKTGESKKIECCSNVLFLPGFEGSRLEKPDMFGGMNRLWEPNRNDDVRKLYMNEDGTSMDSTIYVGGVIDSAFGFKDIYKSFIAMLDSVVAEKNIQEWRPFAYDWRNEVQEIVGGETQLATTTKRLINEVQELARTSRTGKVTLVGHSNGGLVAKRLGYELEKMGKSELIDKAILVASPLLGTPMAAAALLHGEGQKFLGGLLLKSSVARTLGLNAPGAYGLLPSKELFTKISEPIITLAGKAVGTYDDFVHFLTGGDGRVKPEEGDVKTPAILSSNHIKVSQELHQAIDNWKFPTTTEELRVVGWGTPTISSITYASNTPFIKKNIRGDSTVISKSAASPFAHTLYFNQGHYNFEQRKSIQHDNILESDIVKDLIKESIASTSISTKSDSNYVTSAEPDDESPWMKWLTVSVHSPVDLHIYDSRGGHMGPVPLPNVSDSDLSWFENTIGGQVEMIGDEKYYTLPANDTYSVKLQGTGVGTFTFQVQKFEGTDISEVSNTVYKDLPVTPLLEAQTTVSESELSPPLRLDVDGNGISDANVNAGELNPELHLDSIKVIVSSLNLDPKDEKQLVHRIEKIRSELTKNKEYVAKKIGETIEKVDEGHWNLKSVTTENKALLLSLFTNLLSSLETAN